MKRKNIEIKARCSDFDRVRQILMREGADFRGVDQQTDTYFQSQTGILKLREATLPFERGLIFYKRSTKRTPKISNIIIYLTSQDRNLKEVLLAGLEVQTVVNKKRELYTIDNVKFHLDTLPKLGKFVEIEAQDTHGLITSATLLRQCKYYMKILGIDTNDLLNDSYKDLLKK